MTVEKGVKGEEWWMESMKKGRRGEEEGVTRVKRSGRKEARVGMLEERTRGFIRA